MSPPATALHASAPPASALGPIARAGAGMAKRPSVSFEFSPPKTP